MTTSVKRAWSALGTPTMVRIITAGMVAYALVLGGLVVGYVRVQACVTAYSDQSARRTADLAEATDRSTAAQIRVAEALAQAHSITEVRAALDEWAATLRAQEQLRASLPPPRPPSERC